ncbi:lipocalin family protein [Flavobacterium sp. CFS9]|uniref:Lipocalin family protein n=1 Tax=Flavobacterium sp. CFS9 TaxID=3143118 RepID=A0AAT9GWT7_9FLAO
MKNTFMILVLSLLLVSCKQEIKPADIAKLNGYWEIEKVVFDKGEDKDYGMNENFDYFNIKGTKGTRTKVMAQLDGTFLTTDTFEDVSVRFKGDQVFLDYKTDYAKWSEELISVSDETFVVKNDQNKEYHYKKTGPVNLLNDGKKTK